jgi:hypothetical protein
VTLPDAIVDNAAVAGIWGILGIAVATAFRVWPAIKQLSMDESAQLRADRRADYAQLKADMEALKASDAAKETRIAAAETHCAAVTLRIGQLEFVFRMVMDELEAISPGNDVARRAKELIAALMPIETPGPGMASKVDLLSRAQFYSGEEKP